MDAWLIVVITISSGLALFGFLFWICQRRHRRMGNVQASPYSTQIVTTQAAPQQYPPQQYIPQQQQQQYIPPQQEMQPYPQQMPQPNQSFPQQMQQNPQYPQQMQQNPQYPQQPSYNPQIVMPAYIPSTNNSQIINAQNPNAYGPPTNPSMRIPMGMNMNMH